MRWRLTLVPVPKAKGYTLKGLELATQSGKAVAELSPGIFSVKKAGAIFSDEPLEIA